MSGAQGGHLPFAVYSQRERQYSKSVGSRAIILVQIIILLLPSNVISVNLFYLFWDSNFLSVKWA